LDLVISVDIYETDEIDRIIPASILLYQQVPAMSAAMSRPKAKRSVSMPKGYYKHCTLKLQLLTFYP
jgi:hypothetical protein